MANAVSKITAFLNDFADDVVRDEFMLYEPWDVGKRGQWMFDVAEKYHVDMQNEQFIATYSEAPHLFQTGYMFDDTFISSIFGGNQSGKSYCALMDLLIMMTGEKPYSLRYKKGHDTGILREVNDLNASRFGRYDVVTGEKLKDGELPSDNDSWNCGTIKGVGVYPNSKLAPRGQKAWLGTFSQARDEYWWPRLKSFIPDYMIDRSRGNNGVSEKKGIIFLSNGCEIHTITYEQGYAKFEAENVWVIVLDEEPPDERIFTSAIQHISLGGVGVRLIETPYRGLTWTYDKIIKGSADNKDVTIHHCTQFDSPYQQKDKVLSKMTLMKPWEIAARVFGIHSEQRGRPYFDRQRINKWVRSHVPTHRLVEFEGSRVWDSIRDAMAGGIRKSTVYEKEERNEWEVYEDPDNDTAYWMTIDTGMGASSAEDAADRNMASIFRPPSSERNENLSLPVMVATCRSSLETIPFARNCVYTARAYNNCLIAPESKGETASTFIAEIRDYPFMFTMTVINDKTRKPTKKIGFDTNARTRRLIFDLIGDFLAEVNDQEYPNIPHYYTLVELSSLIVGKRGRPDHPNDGTSDCAIAFGIGLYVWIHAKEQIRNNYGYSDRYEEDSVDKWGGRMQNITERRPVLGSKKGLDARQTRARRL